MQRKTRQTGARALFALLCAAAALLVCSKNSPLYPMNDWVDVQCFFTVGRGITHGLVPYLDLYEQKGPLLYLLYALAAAVSETSFLGVFLLETCCFAAFLYFSGRIAEALSGAPVSFAVTAAFLALAVPLSPAFSHGGSAEELFLPAFAAGLYILLKALREKRTLTVREGIAEGALAAAALWMKYTFCGFFLGLGMAVLGIMIAGRKAREIPKVLLSALGGAAAASVLILAWYALRGALPAMWSAYFTDNLSLYSQNIRSGHYADPLPNLLNNPGWFAPLAAGVVLLGITVRRNWRILLAAGLSGVLLFVFTYASGRKYPYYALVMAALSPVGCGMLFAVIPERIREGKGFRAGAAALAGGLLLAGPFLGMNLSQNVYLMKTDRAAMPQYAFAEIIRQSEDQTILNYGFLDGGFYFAAESLPVTRYFCTLNNDLPEMKEEMEEAIRTGKTKYIITRQRELKDAPAYRLTEKRSMLFEGKEWTYYLYERTD